MKHNKEYKFNKDITCISSVVNKLKTIGFDETDIRILKLKDGSEHTFITINGNYYTEMSNLNDALTFIINDLGLLYNFHCEGYIVEDV